MKFIVYRTSAGGPYPLDETPYPPPCEGTVVRDVRTLQVPDGRPLYVNTIEFASLRQFVTWASCQQCPVVLHTEDAYFAMEEHGQLYYNVLEIRDQRE